MKELTLKEKAKAYDEALKAAIAAHKDEDRHLKAALERIFPELKESEDEKIRKALIDYFDDANKADENPLQSYGIHTDNAIVWLEKQGEQKLTDKVKPKFNVGDWVVWQDKCYKVNYNGCGYVLFDQNGLSTSLEYGTIDENAHLWTINDAKPGDVLACNNGWTCIFKTLVNDETFSSYCFMDNTKWFCETGSEGHTLKEEFVKAYNGKIYPATKEQRNLLFQKMKEAGYRWDEEKKELKKINTYCQENCKGFQETGRCFADGECKAKKESEQKSAWSEEDENMLEDTCRILSNSKECTTSNVRWLKSLKPQNNITDEELAQAKKDAYNDALDKIEYHSGEPTFDDGWSAAIDYIQKKSLKPQNHWKPTEEQVEAFEHFVRSIGESGYASPYENNTKLLYSLLNDLKKLKE